MARKLTSNLKFEQFIVIVPKFGYLIYNINTGTTVAGALGCASGVLNFLLGLTSCDVTADLGTFDIFTFSQL